MKDKLRDTLTQLMQIPGLSGHEDRVRRYLSGRLDAVGIASRTDPMGNLIATVPGDPAAPAVMLFAHMDQLGFVVRRIEADGLLRVERLGGVPERALPSQAVLLCVSEGRDVPGVLANKSHHATTADEKYRVVPYAELYIDVGLASAEAVATAGIKVGTPVVYLPRVIPLQGDRLAGTSVDDRAGCAAIVELAGLLAGRPGLPTIQLVVSVQEEFNLRGAVPAAAAVAPDIAIQLDLVLATDTPDMAGRSEVALGGGPAISLYSFHGRGTLNGVLPHPAMAQLFEDTAQAAGVALQRSAHVGALTDLSYVQGVGEGVASIEMGFPMRYSHSSLEVCDLADLAALVTLLAAAVPRIDKDFSLDRDDYT